MALTAKQRSRRGRIAALVSWANTADRQGGPRRQLSRFSGGSRSGATQPAYWIRKFER